MEQNNNTIKTGCRYMDDVRVFLEAIRMGWSGDGMKAAFATGRSGGWKT